MANLRNESTRIPNKPVNEAAKCTTSATRKCLFAPKKTRNEAKILDVKGYEVCWERFTSVWLPSGLATLKSLYQGSSNTWKHFLLTFWLDLILYVMFLRKSCRASYHHWLLMSDSVADFCWLRGTLLVCKFLLRTYPIRMIETHDVCACVKYKYSRHSICGNLRSQKYYRKQIAYHVGFTLFCRTFSWGHLLVY